MFEQETQNQENDNQPVAPAANQVSQESELFNRYEIKSWSFSPRIYKILAVSATFNILALLLVGQSHLLTQKGCDSPLVSKVCQVLDTVYVGSKLIGGNEFSVKDYNKTKIGDADNIDYIEVPEIDEPLDYPEGYFALANPQQYVMPVDLVNSTPGFTPGFEMPPTGSISTNPTNNSTLNGQPILPPDNPGAVQGDIPTNPFGNSGSNPAPRYVPPRYKMPRRPVGGNIIGGGKKMQNQSPQSLSGIGEDKATAKNTVKPSPTPTPAVQQPDLSKLPTEENAKQINKKPFLDLGDTVLKSVDDKTLVISDLSKPFTVSVQAVLNADGTFDRAKTQFDPKKDSGDPKMVSLAKSAVEAIGDSKILKYLKDLNADKVSITLVQDDKEFYAVIVSDQPNDLRAKTIASGLDGLLSLGKIKLADKTEQGDIDTLALLKAAAATSKGKNVVLTFKLDKNDAQQLINRQLQNAQAKRQQPPPQPNSATATKQTQNAGK